MNKEGCHNKQCGMFSDMMPATANCAFVWLGDPKIDCAKYQAGCGAVVPLNNLLSANKRLVAVLELAKDKLERYREDHSGVYLGGMEYTSLMREINAMLELNKSI